MPEFVFLLNPSLFFLNMYHTNRTRIISDANSRFRRLLLVFVAIALFALLIAGTFVAIILLYVRLQLQFVKESTLLSVRIHWRPSCTIPTNPSF